MGGDPLSRAALQDALCGSSLQARYQPIVRLADRAPVSLEVLARLDRSGRGMLEPGEFVPQMELAGLAASLTRAVTACAFADYARHLDGLDMAIALNFPLDVLLLPEALDSLTAEREAAGIPVARVAIELTESQPVSDLDKADFARLMLTLQALREAGYRLLVDDLSPAIPDIPTLLTLPFAALKLDRGVVQDAAQDAAAAAFVADVIARARAAGMMVVAEGVEDQATWERLHAAGADFAQGFLVARPLRAEEVGGWQARWTEGR